MTRLLSLAAFAALAGVAAVGAPRHANPATTQVMVHCPSGGHEAFVTPPQVEIALGDSVEWRMTGEAEAESMAISLKDAAQSWPFTGTLPSGKDAARSGSATAKGTFPYSVHLSCKLPGGGTQAVDIDPDIIIK